MFAIIISEKTDRVNFLFDNNKSKMRKTSSKALLKNLFIIAFRFADRTERPVKRFKSFALPLNVILHQFLQPAAVFPNGLDFLLPLFRRRF